MVSACAILLFSEPSLTESGRSSRIRKIAVVKTFVGKSCSWLIGCAKDCNSKGYVVERTDKAIQASEL